MSSVSRRIREVLREVAERVVELNYPANCRERSIDFVATLARERARPERPSEGVVIKVSPGRSTGVNPETEEDLVSFADAIDGIPLVVDDRLYDNIVFERGRVFAVNERTLENLVKERELIALYRRNELYVALNVELIEREIARGSLRLSEISDVLGLSRKSVEGYLRGPGLISIEKAERLVAEYDARIVLPVSYRVLRGVFERKERARPGLVREVGEDSLVYSLRKTTVDFIVREVPQEGVRSLRFYVDSERTRSVKYARTKVLNALRLARELNAVLEVTAPDASSLETLRREIESQAGRDLAPYIRFSLGGPERAFQRSSV